MIRRLLSASAWLLILASFGCGPKPTPTAPPSGSAVPTTETTATTKATTTTPVVPLPKLDPKVTITPEEKAAETAVEKYITSIGGSFVYNVSHVGANRSRLTVAKFTGTEATPYDSSRVEPAKMAGAKFLYRLDFSGATNVDKALANVSQLPQITDLVLAYSDVSEAGLKAVAALPNLIELDLTHVKKITPLGLLAVAAAPKLERLILSESNVKDDGLLVLGDARNLTVLKLDQTAVTCSGLAKIFEEWPKLVELDLHETKLKDDGLVAVAAVKGLQILSLRGTAITDDGLRTLRNLMKLQKLDLGETANLTGSGVKELADNTRLETINLDGGGLSDEGMKGVAQLRGVRILYLQKTQITDAGISLLATPRGLEELTIEETAATNTSVVKVASEAKALRIVSVRKTKVTKGVVVELARIAPNLMVSFE